MVGHQTRVSDLHAWCIPTVGKDYEVKQRDAMEAGLSGVLNGILATDIRVLLLQIPAVAPGNIIGYEVEEEETPYVLGDAWRFQDTVPVLEAHYSLQLPPGWSYRATWPLETMLAASLSSYQITKASISNLRASDKPFEWQYAVEADHYARTAGDLLLIRPRVIGTKVSGILETKEPREHSVEFAGPERDTDVFEILLPSGYQVDYPRRRRCRRRLCLLPQ